ncbi:LysR family transcriptional regulator [Aeromonas diversa]|uniref:LysR family transcriptional regulator n=1 Tax=Aeromonas diversa TaxID=502790 RepID=UPI003462C223
MRHLDDLLYFLAVARSGSISGAADQLGVNHSTVSRRLAALEASGDTRLLDRTATGYNLTRQGQRLLSHAIAVEQHWQAINALLDEEGERLSGTLSLTLPPALAGRTMMSVLKRFQDANPDLLLNLVVSNDLLSVTRQEVDIAIRATVKPAHHLVGRKLCDYHAACYVRRDLLPGPDRRLDWLGDGGEPPAPMADYALRQAAIIPSTTGRLAAVQSGMGAAELPCFLAAPLGELVRLPGHEPRRQGEIWLLYHPGYKQSRKIRAFASFFPDAFAAIRHTFEGL